MANAYALPRMYTTGAAYNMSVDVRQYRDYLSAHHVWGEGIVAGEYPWLVDTASAA